MNIGVYLRLMRIDKPIGIFLLWAPTAWALWVANDGFPNFKIFIYFLFGTIFMRSAGCIINDIADKDIDRLVARTKSRPLTSGEIGIVNSWILFAGLLIFSLLILLQLPKLCFYEALIALFLAIIYPFTKRFFEAPQLILGLAFSMGIPMAYTASSVALNEVTFLLFGLNFLWIIAYDTMYAMVDREDDLLIGVKSTAILFATHDRFIIAILQIIFHSIWLIIALIIKSVIIFYVIWFLALVLLIYQQWLLGLKNRDAYFKAFLMNSWYGLMMWLALIRLLA